MEISEQIKQRRTAAGLSQEELAERIYVTRQTLSNWETGKTYPDLNSLLRLGDVFQISLDELVKGDMAAMEEEIKKEDMTGFERENRILWGMLLASIVLGFLSAVWNDAAAIACIGILIVYGWRLDRLKSKFGVSDFRQIKAFQEGVRLDEIASAQEKEMLRCRKIMRIHTAVFTAILLTATAVVVVNTLGQ